MTVPYDSNVRIWAFAFGYFASYVPYALLTKSVTSGAAVTPALEGTMLLPISTATSVVGMLIFISAMGWWKHAQHKRIFGLSLPMPRLATFLSGVATTAIVLTTTLAYTFDGVNIIFAMLLMRGGVLLLAPVVDSVTGRPFASIPWYSWAGSALALVALFVGFADPKKAGADLTLVAGINILIYLTAYFFRLRWMSRLAKGRETPDQQRLRRIAYFVEEQMVATPLALLGLVVLALVWPQAPPDDGLNFGDMLRYGFTDLWQHGTALLLVVAIGIGSQGAGVFGALVLLEPQENAYTVPVNRASSVLAGVVGSYLALVFFPGLAEAPSGYEIGGAAVIIAAIVVLSYPVFAKKLARGRAN